MLSAAIVTLTLLQSQGVSPAAPAQQLPEAKDRWERFLTSATHGGKVAVMCDIDSAIEPPYGDPPKEWSEEMLTRAAWAMFRTVEAIDGAYVLRRDPPRNQGFYENGLLGFLKESSPEQMEKFLKQGIALAELPPAAQQSVCRLVAGNFSYANPLLMDRWDTAVVRLVGRPNVSFTNARGEPTSRNLLDLPPTQWNPITKPEVKASKRTPLKGSTGADIDLGPGKVYTVRELAAKVREITGHRLVYDNRIRDEEIFVAGKYTRAGFIKAFSAATTPLDPSFVLPEERLSKKDLLSGELGRLIADHPENEIGTTRSEYLEGQSLSYSDWRLRNPKRSGVLDAFNLPPDANLKLGIRLTLHLWLGEGAHSSPWMTQGKMSNTLGMVLPE